MGMRTRGWECKEACGDGNVWMGAWGWEYEERRVGMRAHGWENGYGSMEITC